MGFFLEMLSGYDNEIIIILSSCARKENFWIVKDTLGFCIAMEILSVV
jgi:hypothetical protein